MENPSREDVGFFPLACVVLLVVFMFAIGVVGFAMEGSGPMHIRPDALLNMAKWTAIIVFGMCFFAFLLRRALDSVPRPHDE